MDVQPQAGPLTSPRATAATAAASSPAPSRSGAAVASSRESGTRRAAVTSASTPIGTLTRNAQCQETCTRTPPTTGPKAAATAPLARPDPHRCRPALRRDGGEQQPEAGRRQGRGADRLHGPRGDEPPHAGRGRARGAREGEGAQPHQEHRLPAVPVGEPSERHEEGGVGDGVGVEHPAEVGDRGGAEVPADLVERDVDHEEVEARHEGREREDGDDGALVRRRPWRGGGGGSRLTRGCHSQRP